MAKQSEYLHLSRLYASPDSALGFVIQYLKGSPYDLKLEITKYLLARFLVPALMKRASDEKKEVEWHARECTAQFDAWGNSIREHFGWELANYSVKRSASHEQQGEESELGSVSNGADGSDEASHLDEKMSVVQSVWGS